ncbi:MAG: hypothetical protein MI923_28105 [Phycisphaerales bacterium]|nr:hypothetical protein [Phycisphaerales bacterium]
MLASSRAETIPTMLWCRRFHRHRFRSFRNVADTIVTSNRNEFEPGVAPRRRA